MPHYLSWKIRRYEIVDCLPRIAETQPQRLKAEGNLARLNREMKQVRAEKEMTVRLQQMERREAELKEQILREQERLIDD